MRTKISVLLFAVIFFLGAAGTVSAHNTGPPYIAVDGAYAPANPMLLYTETSKFVTGEDVATSSGYIAGQPMSFVVDLQNFPNPYADVNGSVVPQFRWDFGDGSAKQEGQTITHTYVKPGTYIVGLEAKFPGKTSDFSDANSVQLDVLPTRGYVRPQAKISINGSFADPTKGIINIKPGYVALDASGSTGDIVSYTWDFSDDTSASGKTVTHFYGHDAYFPLFPVLRVTDKNNIASDTFVTLNGPQQSDNLIMKLFFAIEDFVTRATHRP